MQNNDIHELTLRIPFDLYVIYKKAALYSKKITGEKKSITQILNEALEARKTYIERKYVPDVDR